MQYEAYRDLIQSLEAEAARDPDGYTMRVAAFGVLGYAYILAVFAAFLGLLWIFPRFLHGAAASWVSIKLGLLLIPIGLVLLKPLVMSFPSPRGVLLERRRVPALFAMIDEVATTLAAPRPHRVILTADYNCSIVQRPRLGVLGWPENILILGLPMFETLSRPRFRAILAHELGHLVAHHSTLAGRLHSVSDVWQQLLHRLSSRPNVLFGALERFFRWYGPRFQAMGFVLGRRQEYFADLCSRRVAGVRATRGALVRIEVMARQGREVMEQTLRIRMQDRATPSEDLFPVIAQRMREDPAVERAQGWIDEALRAVTGYEHTHPALRDRLAALESGAAPTLADAMAEAGGSAAQDLLGEALEPLTCDVSAFWAADVAPAWQSRHEHLAALERVAGGEEEVSDASPITDASAAAWATLSARLELDGDRDAPARLAAFLEAHPEHVLARFRLGQVQLERGELAGLDSLERAVQRDSDFTPAACEIAIHFLRAQGLARRAEEYTRRAWEFAELARKADEERSVLRKKDRLVPHDLPADAVARLTRRIARERWIGSALLVRKETGLRSEKPCYVLGLTLHRTWYKLVDPNQEQQAAVLLLQDSALPAGTWMFYLEGELRWARQRLGKVERARIWSRPRRGRSRQTAKAA